MSEDPFPVDSSEEAGGLIIPLWVALAGMVVALVLAVIIMANVLRPLTNLVFPADPEPPLPDGAVELQHSEESSTSDGEWFYGIDMDACQLVEYYIENDTKCRVTPFACKEGVNGAQLDTTGTASVAVCRGTHEEVVGSYSWEVYVNASTGDYPTTFRMFLYKER
jgi:hypothetical protein